MTSAVGGRPHGMPVHCGRREPLAFTCRRMMSTLSVRLCTKVGHGSDSPCMCASLCIESRLAYSRSVCVILDEERSLESNLCSPFAPGGVRFSGTIVIGGLAEGQVRVEPTNDGRGPRRLISRASLDGYNCPC